VAGVLVGFQVLRRTAEFAFMRPARESLYVPSDRADKYKAKNLIYSFVYRGGEKIGSWAQGARVALGVGMSAIAAVGVPLAGAWLALALWLGRANARLQGTTDAAAKPRPVAAVT
jgi:AAA family ATP:ADP antiporter